MVRDGSVVLPGSDAAVIRIKTDSLPVMSAELAAKVGDVKVSEKLIAMTVDCNGAYVYLDPYEGAKAAMAEACRNLACSGYTRQSSVYSEGALQAFAQTFNAAQLVEAEIPG